MNFETKPIIRKAIENLEISDEISNLVPTFPNIQKRPSRYKLLSNLSDKNENKIGDINSLCELIKKIEYNKYNPFKINANITETKDIPTQETDNNHQLNRTRNTSRLHVTFSEPKLPMIKLLNTNSELNKLGKNNDIEKEQYYSRNIDTNNFGEKKKEYNEYVKELDEQEKKYKEKERALLFDNKYANKKRGENLNFNSMKKTIFKLFDSNALKTRNNRSIYSNNSNKCVSFDSKSIMKRKQTQQLSVYKKGRYYRIKEPFIPPMDKFDEFKITIIKKYLLQIDFSCEHNKRKLFVIVDGTVIININYIPGVFIEMPKKDYLFSLNKEEKDKFFNNFLRLCQSKTKSSNAFKNIYTQNRKIIFDLADIKDEDQFIFVSPFNSFKGISLSLSNSVIHFYLREYEQKKKEEIEQKQDDNHSSDDDYVEENSNEDYVHALFFRKQLTNTKMIKRLMRNSTIKKTKQNKSFYHKNEDDIIDYNYYSDNEDRRKKEYKIIEEKYPNRNEFFIYIQNKIHDKKLEDIKKQFCNNKKHRKAKSTTVDLTQIHLNKNKMGKILRKAQRKGFIIKDFSIIKLKNNEHYQKTKFLIKNSNQVKNQFLQNQKKVNKNISHLYCYNIPKILTNPKTNNKFELYDLFTQFKSLVTIWFDLNNNKLNPLFGIDLQTFQSLLAEFQNENDALTKQIFNKINSSSSGMLTIAEFIEGMSQMHKQELKEQVDFFIKVFDTNNKGYFTFEQVKTISKISLKRLMKNQNNEGEVLDEISEFFAKYIYSLVHIDINKGLEISKLKDAVNNNSKLDIVDYFKTFCCCKKLK